MIGLGRMQCEDDWLHMRRSIMVRRDPMQSDLVKIRSVQVGIGCSFGILFTFGEA